METIMNMTITIGKRSYTFESYEIANKFIEEIIESEKYSDGMLEVANCNSYNVLSTLANSDNIKLDVFKKLLHYRSDRVIKGLIRNDKFPEYINKEDLDFIINTFSYETLEYLCGELDELSPELLEYGFRKLMDLNNKEIAYSLARNSNLPLNCLKELAECADLNTSMEAHDRLKSAIDYI